MKRLAIAAILMSTALVFTACRDISQEPLGGRKKEEFSYSAAIDEPVSYSEYIPEIPEIEPAEAEITVQAEDCALNGNLFADKKRKGYSGDGYITGFMGGQADYLVIPVDIPVSQHYDITVCVASDKPVKNSVIVNEDDIGMFNIENSDGKFTTITYYGIYIEAGSSTIRINQGSDEFDVDYIKLVNNTEIYEDDIEISEKLVSEKTSYEARDLFRFLKENHNKNIITGQYVSSSKNTELEYIYKKTGKYPTIRFGDIGAYSEREPFVETEINAARDWDEKGGIVGFMWYWNSPSDEKSSVYAEQTDFSLKEAVTKEDIATLGISEIQDLYRQGKISRECMSIVEDIDTVSEGFLKLAEDGIPVLWKPLHDAGSGLYWWGADGPKAYKWLYDLMFERMTLYHKLDNLIWIWNGQDEKYLVDDDKYDIAAANVYLEANINFGSRAGVYQWLKKITDSKKMIALSESSGVPGIDEMLRDNSVWSYFGLWYGNYLSQNEALPGEVYTDEKDLIKIYNSENSITLDKYAGIYGPQ